MRRQRGHRADIAHRAGLFVILLSHFIAALFTLGRELTPYFLHFLESTATITEDNSGKNFILAFPENIAYYHPEEPSYTIKITALYENTVITVKHAVDGGRTVLLSDSEEFFVKPILSKLELTKSKFSNSTVHINSTEDVLIYVINQKGNSVQTALLTPVENLGTEYLIPPVPKIKGTTEPVGEASTDVTERGPFRLIIINSELLNSVTVEGTKTERIVLNPYEIAQVWVREGDALRVVKAEQAVAVYFGHPCAIRYNCTCGMLFTPLPPALPDKLNYIIPPAFIRNAEAETFVLLSEQQSSKLSPINPASLSTEVSGSAILYRPGLLLNLIPEQEFGSCYVLEVMTDVDGRAVIVVNKDQTDGVYDGKLPVASPVWEDVPGTDYVSATIPLTTKKVLWHKYSKMAVYFAGMNDATMFGHPAPAVSRTPGMNKSDSL